EVTADSAGHVRAAWSGFSVGSGFNLYSRWFSAVPTADAGNAVAAARAVAGASDGTGGGNGTGGLNTGLAPVGSLNSAVTGWRVSVSGPPGKLRLNWGTEAGARYQVQTSSDLKNWTNLAGPRSGTGAADSVGVDVNGESGFFRVLKLP